MLATRVTACAIVCVLAAELSHAETLSVPLRVGQSAEFTLDSPVDDSHYTDPRGHLHHGAFTHPFIQKLTLTNTGTEPHIKLDPRARSYRVIARRAGMLSVPSELVATQPSLTGGLPPAKVLQTRWRNVEGVDEYIATEQTKPLQPTDCIAGRVLQQRESPLGIPNNTAAESAPRAGRFARSFSGEYSRGASV